LADRHARLTDKEFRDGFLPWVAFIAFRLPRQDFLQLELPLRPPRYAGVVKVDGLGE
jgi:hypothetical protein